MKIQKEDLKNGEIYTLCESGQYCSEGAVPSHGIFLGLVPTSAGERAVFYANDEFALFGTEVVDYVVE